MDQPDSLRLLAASYQMRTQLELLMRHSELSREEYMVLRSIKNLRAGGLKVTLLSELLNLSKPSVSRILNALEKKELICREIGRDDRRSITVTLTPKGLETVKQRNAEILSLTERIARELGEPDFEQLIALLDRLTAIYERLNADHGTEDKQ